VGESPRRCETSRYGLNCALLAFDDGHKVAVMAPRLAMSMKTLPLKKTLLMQEVCRWCTMRTKHGSRVALDLMTRG
jgi:hypothetical protein